MMLVGKIWEKLSRLRRIFSGPERHGWSSLFPWLPLCIAVGFVAGLGAIVFEVLLRQAIHYFIFLPTGYLEPVKAGPAASETALAGVYRWLLIIPALGGLISALLFLIAPEAKGEGADAMIEAFHERGGFIRRRVPFVKILASAITIGSGGSAGKEGPIAQIGAGFGSFLSVLLHLKPRDRRILVLAGAAGGLGAIFHAPLGTALFAPEVLYRETEFESESVLPCIVSAIVASSTFNYYFGRTALFFPGPVDFSLVELLAYAIFGVVCALAGYIFVKFFYGARDLFFQKLPIPNILKPALGGLLMGGIAFLVPQVLDSGYGWVQAAMEGKIFWETMLLLVLMKNLATGLTISSGGSGGVLGPSVFMGAMLGGAFGVLGHKLAPGLVIHPNAFVLVGIGGFFGGVAKVPVAAIIMACEMSKNFTLLVPLMVVATVSYLVLGRVGIYEKQVLTRMASPAHVPDFARGLLQGMRVFQVVNPRPVTIIPENLPFPQLIQMVSGSQETYFPLVDQNGKMNGILSINDIREVIFEEGLGGIIVAKDVATPNVVRVFWEDSLQEALDKMALLKVNELPVVHRENPDKIISMISKREIISYYHARSREVE